MSVICNRCLPGLLLVAALFFRPAMPMAAGRIAPGQVIDAADITKYVRDLKSSDEKIRYDAAYALGEAGKEAAAAVPDLIAALRDKDIDVRSAAAGALGKVGKAATDHASEIAALVRDKDEDVRNAAIEALGELNPPAATSPIVLIEALADESENVRGAAVAALGKIAATDKDLAPGICKRATALIGVGSAPARAAAVQVLGSLESVTPESVQALILFLSDRNGEIRSAAVQALAGVGAESIDADRIARLLTDGAPGTRAAAADLMGHLGKSAAAHIPDLLKALKDPDSQVRSAAGSALRTVAPADALTSALLVALLSCDEPSVSRWAAERLIEKPPPAGSDESRNAADLVAALLDKSGSDGARAAAARVLAKIGRDAPDAAPALVRALQDGNSDVRRLAAAALGENGIASVSSGPRIAALLKDSRPFVREAAILALEQLRSSASSVLGELYAALADTDRPVHNAAFHALQSLTQEGAPSHPGLLLAFVNDDVRVRNWAVTAIEAMSPLDGGSITRICEIASAKRPELRISAIGLLGRLKVAADTYAPVLIKALCDSDRGVRLAAADALGANQATAKPFGMRIARLLLDTRPYVRASAADALAQIGAVPVVSAGTLLRLLNDDDKEVRRRAAEALASMHPLPAYTVPALEKACSASYPPVRYHAVRALINGAPSPVPALLRALQDPDGGVRCAAVVGLGERGAIAPGTAPALTLALKDSEAAVRRAAAEALGRISTEMARATNFTTPREKERLCRSLETADLTLMSVPAGAVNWDIREQAAASIRRAVAAIRGEKPVRRGWEVGNFRGTITLRPTQVQADDDTECERYTKLLDSTDPALRAHAAYSLAELGPAASAASTDLVSKLRDPAPEVRAATACALGNMQLYDPAVNTGLVTALFDTDATVRDFAAFAIGRLSNLSELDLGRIAVNLKDSRSWVRLAAARGMAYVGRRTAEHLPALISTLKDRDADVRLAAADAIRATGLNDPSTVADLRAVQTDANGDIRAAAARAVSADVGRQDGNDGLSGLADRDPQVRAEAYRGMWRKESSGRMGRTATVFGTSTMPRLLAGLKDPDRRVKEAAAEAIELAADQLASPDVRMPAARFGGGPRGQGGFRGPGFARGPGAVPIQMDAAVREDLQTCLDALLALPEGAIENSARIELTPLRIRQALAMFKTLR